MSDRFDIRLERKLETKPAGGDEEVVGVRRIELITGRGRRREWPSREKARILLSSGDEYSPFVGIENSLAGLMA
jgi:hypothetical protein